MSRIPVDGVDNSGDKSTLNRLAQEKSPYLQQHAANPVDWYPWGEKAFAAARAADKPIFLSIGYSTCHWCHVMAHESFENPEIAAVMNRLYINIKVDREERPDIDALYMTAVQALTGSGGWPMSMWLTPDLKPFYGGTYFPPEDRWGRTGFPSVLEQLAQVYAGQKERVAEAAAQMVEFLRGASNGGRAGAVPSAADAAQATFRSLDASFDPAQGGFSPPPKFPMPVYLEFLLDHHARAKEPKALEMAAFSFRKMAEGGLYDHLGGGFARYSTDGHWLVPHFEKMLYDNAQLLKSGASLWAATNDPFFRDAVLGTADYLMRDLRHAEGGFFSAEDADSEGKEGTFYLWTLADFRRLLGGDADAAAARFGVTPNGNFQDPHTRELGMNVLSLAGPAFPTEAAARSTLFAARARRPRPHRDEKIITEWNGLAISALGKAGFLLNEERLVRAAEQAADFIETALYDRPGRRLFRRWRDGDRAVDGHLSDHAQFIEGLLDLFEATGDPHRLELALELHRLQNDLFFDAGTGGYFTSRPSSDLLVRMKEDADNVIPSGNATAVLNGFRLAAITGDAAHRSPAEGTLRFFASALANRPVSLSKMTSTLPWAEGAFREVVITGDPGEARTRELLAELRRSACRDAVVVLAGSGARREALARLLPWVAALSAPGAAAFICRRYACQPPSTDAFSFRAALTA